MACNIFQIGLQALFVRNTSQDSCSSEYTLENGYKLKEGETTFIGCCIKSNMEMRLRMTSLETVRESLLLSSGIEGGGSPLFSTEVRDRPVCPKGTAGFGDKVAQM